MKTDVQLADGAATHMGEGVFVITQKDERGAAQAVVLTPGDLRALWEADSRMGGAVRG